MVSNGVSTIVVKILMVLMASSGNSLIVSNGLGYPNGNIPVVWWCLMVLYADGFLFPALVEIYSDGCIVLSTSDGRMEVLQWLTRAVEGGAKSIPPSGLSLIARKRRRAAPPNFQYLQVSVQRIVQTKNHGNRLVTF